MRTGGLDLAAIRALLDSYEKAPPFANADIVRMRATLSSLLAAYEAERAAYVAVYKLAGDRLERIDTLTAQVTKLETVAREAMRKAEAARAEERAAVVAWLRDGGAEYGCDYADHIERGEHVAKEVGGE